MIKPFLFAAAILGAAAPALAQDSGADEWARSTAASKRYSIETPCTAEAVERDSAYPLVVGSQVLDESTNVSCKIGEAVFSSGIVSVSEDEIDGDNVFDVTIGLINRLTLRPEVKVSMLEIDGRRALLSREQRGDEIAQTGIVELSDREMLMIISGGKKIDGMDMAVMIDRHVNSLKVASK